MVAYNLSSFAGAGAQFFDSNGDPLTGGKLYTYTAGTTTPKATYTTNSGAVANANPIILDAAGRTPNEIWLEVGVQYKFILKTSADVTIGTYDNLPAINDPFSINSLLSNVTGTNAIAATATPTLTAYAAGQTYSFVAANSNTAAATLAIDGLTAKSITKNGTAALTAGDIQAGKLTWVEYDGTSFQLVNNIVYGGSIENGTIVSLSAPVTVAQGGTGRATLTANNVLLGNGTTAVQFVAPGAVRNALRSNGTTWASTPISDAPQGSRAALRITVASNSTATVTADAVSLTDGTNLTTVSAISLTLNSANSGANGLDTGAVGANTWYAVWVIYDATNNITAGLLSTSATAPTMPAGYTYKQRFGWVRTDASNNFYRTIQIDNAVQYVVGTNPTTMRRMLNGSSGSVSVPTWTAVSVSNFVPSTASRIRGTLGAQGGYSMTAPNNAYGNNSSTTNPPPVLQAISAGAYGTAQYDFLLESTNIYYASDNAGAAIYCTGWVDAI